MKSIFKLSIILLVLCGMVSCKKDKDPNVTRNYAIQSATKAGADMTLSAFTLELTSEDGFNSGSSNVSVNTTEFPMPAGFTSGAGQFNKGDKVLNGGTFEVFTISESTVKLEWTNIETVNARTAEVPVKYVYTFSKN